jgi:hypothetical protein
MGSVLPNDKIEQAGWKGGVEDDLDAKKGVITLRPKDTRTILTSKRKNN